MEFIWTILKDLAYIIVAFLWLFVGKLVFDYLRPSFHLEKELVKTDNFALALSFSGYLIGLSLGLGGAIFGPSQGFLYDLLTISVYSFFSIILLNISLIISDKFIFPKFRNIEEEILRDQNCGVGAVDAGISIASGLIILGAISGEEGNILGGLLSSGVYWIFGQLIFIVFAKIYPRLMILDLQKELEKDNIAVGVVFGGLLVALGNLIRFAIHGEFDSILDGVINLGYLLAPGLIALILMPFLFDRVIFKMEAFTEELLQEERPNLGVGFLLAGIYILTSFIVGWSLS